MSKENIKKGISIMLLSATAVSIGQLLWKLGIENNILVVFSGFTFYAIGALLMVVSYRFGSVSILQPIISFSYILSLIFGYIVLNEPINIMKICGIFFIILGIIILSGKVNILRKSNIKK